MGPCDWAFNKRTMTRTLGSSRFLLLDVCVIPSQSHKRWKMGEKSKYMHRKSDKFSKIMKIFVEHVTWFSHILHARPFLSAQ